MQSKVFSTNKTLKVGSKLMDLSIPKVMGILNVTPDSFYDGGRFEEESTILKQTEKMLREGADLIDIGGNSTRPGAPGVLEEDELKRVLDSVKAIIREFPQAVLSVDSFRASVARAAVLEGALLINDISGGEMDPDMFETVAALQVPYILMHMRGTPETMNSLSQYENLLRELLDYFHQKIYKLCQLGVKDIIIDPGFGFAKTVKHNFELLDQLNYLRELGRPVLAGLSRKSMIWRTLETDAEGALNGTTALNMVALSRGASILRVHDVAEAVECIRLFGQLTKEETLI